MYVGLTSFLKAMFRDWRIVRVACNMLMLQQNRVSLLGGGANLIIRLRADMGGKRLHSCVLLSAVVLYNTVVIVFQRYPQYKHWYKPHMYNHVMMKSIGSRCRHMSLNRRDSSSAGFFIPSVKPFSGRVSTFTPCGKLTIFVLTCQ